MILSGVDMIPDVLTKYKERFVYVYTVTGFVALVVFGAVPHLSSSNKVLAFLELSIASALLLNVVLYRKHRNYTLLSNVAHLLILLTFVMLIVTGGYKGTGIFWTFTYPLLSFFLNSKREVFFWNITFVLTVALLYLWDPDAFYYDFITLRQAFGAYAAIFVLAYAYNSVVSNLVKALAQKAAFDPLTGLYSRSFLLENLEKAIERVKRDNEKTFLLIYLDLDNFKRVNDRFGHSVGDEVLRRAADRIRKSFRKGDVVARFGGDEFMVIAYNADRDGVERRLVDLKERVEKELRTYGISVSWGIVQIPDEGLEAGDPIRKAHSRMYRMKSANRS